MSRRHDVPTLVARAREGDPRSVARLISLVENGDPALPEVAAALAPYAGGAQVVGLTGSPGVGKSTTTNELVRALRQAGRRVGVLAVDPSSPFTGGAILGDRVRMQEHTTDRGVYIRSRSSRGQLGGLSAATGQAVRVLEGAGCDVVLVETVGVGQAEVEIASLADTTLVLLAPGMGDAIQAVKAGVLEVADVFVINKADRPGADATYRDIQGMLGLGERAPAPAVDLRWMSSGAQLGGLAAATPQAVRVLEGAGCDVILVETVGVGQAEVEIASLADTTLVLLAPGMGDAIQAVKAGVLEIADVFVINKADRPGADATYRDIQGMLGLGERAPGDWRPQVVRATAVKGEGIDDVVAAVAKHRDWLDGSGNLQVRRERRAAVEVEAIALGTLRARIGSLREGTALSTLAAAVAKGERYPYAAADELIKGL